MFNWRINKKIKEELKEDVLRHIDSLYNAALGMTRNKEDAEDLVQEAALRAYRFYHKFRQGSNFKAWIITILRNTYINEYRKRIKEPVKVEFEALEDSISLPGINRPAEGIFSEALKLSVDKLPEELRTTITLFYIEDLAYKEIAGIMNVPVGTVMSRLYTAREILRKSLSTYAKKREI